MEGTCRIPPPLLVPTAQREPAEDTAEEDKFVHEHQGWRLVSPDRHLAARRYPAPTRQYLQPRPHRLFGYRESETACSHPCSSKTTRTRICRNVAILGSQPSTAGKNQPSSTASHQPLDGQRHSSK
jgi:hypothetical protein